MDRKELEAWLKDRPREDAILIAQRAALRVFPLWASRMSLDWARELDLTTSPVMRALLTSGVAHAHPTHLIRKAAEAADAAAADAAAGADANDAAAAAAAYAAAYAADAAATNNKYAAASAYAADYAARMIFWRHVELDVAARNHGSDLTTVPIWHDPERQALPSAELEGLENLARETGDRNSFWHRWWFAVKRGEPMDWDLQRDVALIPEEVWQAGPKAVIVAIAEIEAGYAAKSPAPPTPNPLARTYAFDFVEHERMLRLTGVALDFEGRPNDEIAKCLKALKEWKENLTDWLDYARDALRSQNDPSLLFKSAEKLETLIGGIKDPKDFSASRLVAMGGNLRLLSLDEQEREKVGDTLAAMLDTRIQELGSLLGQCFGHVLARLEALEALRLGDHDPARLIEEARKLLDRIKATDSAELMQLNDEARLAINEMLQELKELDAAISSGGSEKHIALLKERFANRYGSMAATIGRAVEKGREYGTKATSRFDEAVKWYKRWETLDKIVEWFQNFGGPPGL